jgi:hypothetical protein
MRGNATPMRKSLFIFLKAARALVQNKNKTALNAIQEAQSCLKTLLNF